MDQIDPDIGEDNQEELAAEEGFFNWLEYVDNLNADWSDGGVNYGN